MTTNDIRRAHQRRTQLHDRTAGTLELLADIYRDNDWKLLADPTSNTPFRTFTHFVAAELSISPAYARRYQQTIRDLVLPVRDIAGHHAATAITLADTERLGRNGITAFLATLTTDPITGPIPPPHSENAYETPPPPPPAHTRRPTPTLLARNSSQPQCPPQPPPRIPPHHHRGAQTPPAPKPPPTPPHRCSPLSPPWSAPIRHTPPTTSHPNAPPTSHVPHSSSPNSAHTSSPRHADQCPELFPTRLSAHPGKITQTESPAT